MNSFLFSFSQITDTHRLPSLNFLQRKRIRQGLPPPSSGSNAIPQARTGVLKGYDLEPAPKLEAPAQDRGRALHGHAVPRHPERGSHAQTVRSNKPEGRHERLRTSARSVREPQDEAPGAGSPGPRDASPELRARPSKQDVWERPAPAGQMRAASKKAGEREATPGVVVWCGELQRETDLQACDCPHAW